MKRRSEDPAAILALRMNFLLAFTTNDHKVAVKETLKSRIVIDLLDFHCVGWTISHIGFLLLLWKSAHFRRSEDRRRSQVPTLIHTLII